MAVNLLTLVLVIGATVLFGWLTRKAWKAGKPIVKWAGTILGGFLTLILLSIAIVGTVGVYRFYNPPHGPVMEIQVEGTSEQIERGRHLAAAFCVDCHSPTADFPMTGGVDLGKDLPMNLGSYYSANLTPAGRINDWTDGEIFRALRDNVDADGQRLVSMANTNVRNISDEDMLALIAFLRSQKPVESDIPSPATQPNFLALLLSGAHVIPERPLVTETIVAPGKEASPEYGRFMVSFLDCKSCHGEDLNGGTNPIGPKGPSLRLVKAWTEEEFITALRTGEGPNGYKFGDLMPWRSTGRLDDVELSALYQYLVSLE